MSTCTAVRPFGLTLAVPADTDTAPVRPALTLCPDRQLSVTADGVPFVHAPELGTQLTTTSQTKEDGQLATDTENDTDR